MKVNVDFFFAGSLYNSCELNGDVHKKIFNNMALENIHRADYKPSPRQGVGLGIGIGLLGALLTLLPAMADWEQRFGLQWLFALRGVVSPPAEIVLLAINSETADVLDIPEKPAKWPRSLHAQAVNQLHQAGVAAIVFDLFFEENRPEDGEFADAIGRAGNVIIVKKLQPQTELSLPATGLLQQAALSNAPFVLPREPVRVDGFWTFKSGAGEAPTMPAAALQVYALSQYQDLLVIAGKYNARLVADLPPNLAALLSRKNLDQVAAKLRAAFRHDLTLAPRALTDVDSMSQLPAEKKRILRALIRMYAADEAQFLNFYGPPRTFPTIPFHRILQTNAKAADIDWALFKDKVVFIGFSASNWRDYESLRDDYHTVYSQANGLRLSGVEIAATAFANLLQGSDIKPLATPRQMGVLGLWGVLTGLLAWLFTLRRALLALALLALGYLFGVRFNFAVNYSWWPLVIPLVVQLPVAFVSATLLKYREAKRQRNRAIDVAGQFVPADVLNRSLADVGPAAPETRLAYGVCLATDVKNYTQLSETLEPQTLARLMNDYFAILNREIERHGGIIADMRGDALLALWAGDEREVALRQQACHAALSMRALLKEFNATPNRPKLETRIGLHAGQVAVGTLGAAGGHLEFRAVGDIVNTASRVEGLNKALGTSLLATQEVIAAVNDIVTRPLGRFKLAGKSQSLEIVELVSAEPSWVETPMQQSFSTALAFYRAGNVRQAASGFAEVLSRWSDDGPGKFYAERCRVLLESGLPSTWDATVPVEQK